jgi:ArsR family transcriptional regulator, arsenate/arsenite/antimonite-responsive transcriptional repressor
LNALGNPTRLKIFRALVRAGDNGLPVGKLQLILDIAPSTLSHHLKTTLICRANYAVMRSLVDFMVAECCADISCAPSATKSGAA